MAMTNAQKQAAWRARRAAELGQLRKQTKAVIDTKGQRQDIIALTANNEYLRKQVAELERKLQATRKDNATLKKQWFRQLRQMCHPDKLAGASAATLEFANKVTRWLNIDAPRK